MINKKQESKNKSVGLIQIDNQIWIKEEGVTVMIFQNYQQLNRDNIIKISEDQNSMAKRHEDFFLKIESIDFPFNQNTQSDHNDQQTFQVILLDSKILYFINKARIQDEFLQIDLFNQACVLLQILSQEQSILIPKLTIQNFFFSCDKLMISLISDQLELVAEQRFQNIIAEIMQIILKCESNNLNRELRYFFQLTINELIKAKDINQFLIDYSYQYQKLKQKFKFMIDLPEQLKPKGNLENSDLSSASTSCSMTNLDDQRSLVLENKMIYFDKYQDQAQTIMMLMGDEHMRNSMSKIVKLDENYYYYFDYKFLVHLKHNLSNQRNRQIDNNKIEKINTLVELLEGCSKMKQDQNYEFKDLLNQKNSYKYYALNHMEQYYLQQKNSRQLIQFRQKYRELIIQLNAIDCNTFEFNQIRNEFNYNFYKERNDILQWIIIESDQSVNSLLNQFIKFNNHSKNSGQCSLYEGDIKDDYEKKVYQQFSLCYLIQVDDLQIGYAVDFKRNYYKGVFKNGELVFGDILETEGIRKKIIQYKNVRLQSNKIYGENCQKNFYSYEREPFIYEKYRGIIKNGQYNGLGELNVLLNQEKHTLIGDFKDGLLEGKGINKIEQNLRFKQRYEGKFTKGKYDDNEAKVYLNAEKTQFELRKYQLGILIATLGKYDLREGKIQKISN